ncbi:MFS transporter [Luteolibacter yonseiensis]|uniref:MFS transporter n=1 Tax=Luteolibacter yonseiensis TaxID=1144680 RepID=A0A934R4K9_9BACT|nr:MFS transporter [Luteolibacter yonseiensis]MBK1816822.1 MFS transporter [Luteolibacter yonseiensis]
MNTTARPTTLLQDLASLPGQYWILFGGTLVNRFGSFVMPFLVIYLKMKGHDEKTIGFTLGAYGAGGLCAGILGGWLSDRFGRKHTMLISCAGAASFMLLLSQAEGVPMFVLATFMTGLSSGIYAPAASALMADLIPPELRVRAFACQRWAINVGFALGMATAGFMAKKSFLALFIADAATTLLLGLTILIGLKPRVVPLTEKVKSGWGHALRHINQNTPFKMASIAGFLTTLVFLQMGCTYSLQTTQGAGLDERTYGLLMAFNGIIIACLELPLIGFTRRFSPVKVIAAGYLLLGAGMGLNVLGATLPVLILSMGIFTIGEMIAMPVSNGYMAGLAPDEMRGRYQGVVSITWSSATMVGPTFGIMLYRFNPTVLWTCAFALSLAAACLMLASRGKAGRDQALPR